MGCEEMPKTSNEYDESNKNNLDKSDLNINISNDNDNSDKEVEDFFSSHKNKEELSAFLISTKYIHKYNINQSEMPNKIEKIEIYYEYEKCDEISKKRKFRK